MSVGARRRRVSRSSPGQALVLVALSIVVILGMASVAIDVGRLLTERRVMQNAADAAALGAAKSVVLNAGNAGATVATVRQAARDILTIDLASSPVGVPPFTAAEPPVFDGPTAPGNLIDGIVVSDASGAILADTSPASAVSDVRVALRTSIDFLLGRAIGVNAGSIEVRAHVGLSYEGNMMPVAVRRYIGGSGPNNPVPNPCPDPSSSYFFDLASTSETSCQGQIDTSAPIAYGGRTPASLSDPGPIIELVGQGATPNAGGVSFRGFITLDIRNFQTTTHVYYNGVTPGMQSNTLKNLESGWVAKGYPGPGFPPVTSPPDPMDQVGIMDGNSAGLVVDSISSRFRVGDIILCALYDGTVKTIPAFWLDLTSPVPTLTAGDPPIASAGTVTITPNKAYTDITAISIPSKPAWLTIDVSPTTVTANYPQGTALTLTGAQAAAGTPPQIDTLWVRGSDTNQPNQQNAPDYNLPISVDVGTVTKDFDWSPKNPLLAPTTWGDIVTYTGTLTAAGPSDFSNSNGIDVSLDQTGAIYPAWPVGSYWFNGVQGQTSATVHLSNAVTTGNGQKSTTTYQGTFMLTVNTTLLGAQGLYTVPLLMHGTNTDAQSVTHTDLVKVQVDDPSSISNYVDIIGFGAYKITAMNANTIWGESVSPVRPTPDDAQLSIALTPRLMPW